MAKGNLLIVDDEVLLLNILTRNLEDCADKIYTAVDGIDALAILEKEQVHCVICDINMPRMNGLALIKKIRADNNQIPFIFFTGHGNGELMLEVSKYGAYDFFNKPDYEGLEEAILRGLSDGFKEPLKRGSQEEFLSEYHKMLNTLK
ncbi:MAG TPA: response regulator [Bacteriovoracaceae bacterium]|nr:response regulator [Bacteriovoracaceae bacterium]